MVSPRIGIYPGTFDPITFGHMDVVRRALNIVDRLIIAIADDVPKTPIFNLEQRVQMVERDVSDLSDANKVEVLSFTGLLVDFAESRGATIIVRGLRAVSDFEYEFQLSSMNSKMKPDIETIFLPASESTQFIASRFVREIARLGGDVSPLVSENVANMLREYYRP